MKTIYLTLSTGLAMAIIAANLGAKQLTVVYPTGIFPTDVQNVQAAINHGGTVLLKATDPVGHPLAFNFGPAVVDAAIDKEVSITRDASLMGEQIGANRTTINGGVNPVRIFGGTDSIEGIKFNGPLNAAILIHTTTGLRIVDNEIENVVPLPVVFPGFSFTITDGIDAFAVGRPADISGNLIISGNSIGDLTGTFAIGVQVDSVAANVTISNNTLQLGQSPDDPGFVNSSGIACIRCHSAVAISNNAIMIGQGFVFDGIVIFGDSDARYHLFDNTINCQGPIPDGIDVFGQTGDPGPIVSAVIERNSITVHNEIAGIGLGGAVNNCTIQGNTVTGDAGAAIIGSLLLPNGDMVRSNRFLNNDIASVNASIASIFFDTNTVNNLVRGQCVSVVDLGTGNNVSCPSSHSNVNSSAFTTRQQMIQRALQAQSAVRAQSNGANRP